MIGISYICHPSHSSHPSPALCSCKTGNVAFVPSLSLRLLPHINSIDSSRVCKVDSRLRSATRLCFFQTSDCTARTSAPDFINFRTDTLILSTHTPTQLSVVSTEKPVLGLSAVGVALQAAVRLSAQPCIRLNVSNSTTPLNYAQDLDLGHVFANGIGVNKVLKVYSKSN